MKCCSVKYKSSYFQNSKFQVQVEESQTKNFVMDKKAKNAIPMTIVRQFHYKASILMSASRTPGIINKIFQVFLERLGARRDSIVYFSNYLISVIKH